MPGHSPAKTGVNALSAGHPRLSQSHAKTWMAGTSPAMTGIETWPLVSSTAELAQRRCGHLLGRDAEMAVKVLVGRAGAEAVHADEHAIRADDRVPALAHRGFDRDVNLGLTDHRAARCGIRGKQQLEARHRNHPRRNAALLQKLLRLDRNRNFRAGREQRYVRLAVRGGDLVGAGGAAVLFIEGLAQ